MYINSESFCTVRSCRAHYTNFKIVIAFGVTCN